MQLLDVEGEGEVERGCSAGFRGSVPYPRERIEIPVAADVRRLMNPATRG